MKRFLSIALVAMMILSIAVVFTSCGDSDGPLSGVYVDDSLSLIDMKTTITFEGNKFHQEEWDGDEVWFDFEGTYEVDGTNITLTCKGTDTTGTISEDMKTITINDGSEDGAVYTKQ